MPEDSINPFCRDGGCYNCEVEVVEADELVRLQKSTPTLRIAVCFMSAVRETLTNLVYDMATISCIPTVLMYSNGVFVYAVCT